MKKYVFVAALTAMCLRAFSQEDSTQKQNLFKPSVKELLLLKPLERREANIASNVITDPNKQPASVTVINWEQLKLSGARTLSEALMLFVPGYFAVEDQDDIISGFRGLAPDNNSKVLLLINGQNLNTEFFWGPPDAILNSPNLEYIERVEVIRGPGSVTLGQGALLGVINIITKDAKKEETGSAQFSTSAGLDNYFSGGLDIKLNTKGIKSYSHISGINYDGQELRREGWAEQQGNQGFAGGKVADMGHRLRRTSNTSFVSFIQYKNLTINVLKVSQKRDLYNFYRDRELLKQDLLSISLTYDFFLSRNITNKTSISGIEDNYFLSSLTGTTMGGTAERRYGAKSIFNIDNLFKGNKLAVGVEFRDFLMGRNNKDNNNFIANKINTFDPATANQLLTMGYKQEIRLLSIFAENVYSINAKVDLFAAFRYDQHPFWGQNVSPRFGVIYSPNKDVTLRASYQSGFRGAVGLHYSGGYRRDGMLRADNYSNIETSGIPDERNVNSIKPERINNSEISVRWAITDKFSLNTVAFYNTVENVIDVGVIYRDPTQFTMINIGTDLPGDWNGYWYFKNTPGTFSQIGAEAVLSYTDKKFSVQLTQALANVLDATQAQKDLAKSASSMYLSSSDRKNIFGSQLHYKAYPEMVTRLNILANPTTKLSASLNTLYYSDWYSPAGDLAKGGVVVNLGVGYQFTNKLDISVMAKNITDNRNLYPMNSNANGPDVSPGTPGLESTTFWTTVRVKL